MTDEKRAADDAERYDGDSEESRRAFRDYDLDESVASKTPWQVWRDACAWQAALSARADGGKDEAVATLHDDGYWTWKGTPPHESNYAGWRMDVYAAPQAECAPREAQPVAFVEGDEVQRVLRWNKDVAAFNYGIGTALYAAPTPERADASNPSDKQGAITEEMWQEVAREPVSPLYKSAERADAEKDAALTHDDIYKTAYHFMPLASLDPFMKAIDAAILAAKEKKS